MRLECQGIGIYWNRLIWTLCAYIDPFWSKEIERSKEGKTAETNKIKFKNLLLEQKIIPFT